MIQLEERAIKHKMFFFAFLVLIYVKESECLNIVLKLYSQLLLQLLKENLKARNGFFRHAHELPFSVGCLLNF